MHTMVRFHKKYLVDEMLLIEKEKEKEKGKFADLNSFEKSRVHFL